MGDGISHLYLHSTLDTGYDISHASARDLLARMHLHLQNTDLVRIIFLSSADELDLVSRLDGTVHHLEIRNDSSERVEHRVKDKGLQRSVRVSCRSRNRFHYCVQHFLHTLAGLSRCQQHLLRLASQKIHHLIRNHIHHRRLHIYLVQHGNDLQVVLYGKIQIGYCLSLNTLSGIHNQKRTLTGSDGTGHLIGKVHVARSVDQVESVLFSVIYIVHLDRMALDGDALLLLKVHGVQNLVLHVTRSESVGYLQHPVRQGTLAMVDMGYDTEISCLLHCNAIIRAKIIQIFLFLLKPFPPSPI